MPKFFQKNLLASACATLATLTGLLASAPSGAVSLSQNGQGQVLIYPYYTVRGGNDTGLSVLNSTDQTKAVSVRLRESRNGREVTRLTLFLAPHDMWTAAITATADGAKLVTGDKSCISPQIPAEGIALSNARFDATTLTPGFVQSGGDGAGTTLDRTREGYIEVIEMGVVSNAANALAFAHAPATGQPSCSSEVINADMGPQAGVNALAAPSGGLTGSATLINVLSGTEYSYEPVVLEHFSNVNLWSATEAPDLRSASPKTSLVLDKGRGITSTWSKGEDAVSAVLTHASLANEFVLESTTLSGTDWVVTMPTKHYYVPVVEESIGLQPQWPPFDRGFNGYACNWINEGDRLHPWNREGANVGGYVDFATRPPYDPVYCWETSVVAFGEEGLLGSLAPYENTGNVGWNPANMNGWAEQRFNMPHQKLTSLEGHVYKGLPVTGFMVHDFVNGNVGGLLSNYGGNFDHKYTTDIEVD